ncbi:unnamed protein product [Calypogeia fissa]
MPAQNSRQRIGPTAENPPVLPLPIEVTKGLEGRQDPKAQLLTQVFTRTAVPIINMATLKPQERGKTRPLFPEERHVSLLHQPMPELGKEETTPTDDLLGDHLLYDGRIHNNCMKLNTANLWTYPDGNGYPDSQRPLDLQSPPRRCVQSVTALLTRALPQMLPSQRRRKRTMGELVKILTSRMLAVTL